MDPHFAVPLSNGYNLCYSLQGMAYFIFNLVSDPLININAYFIPPEAEAGLKEYSTFLGDVGIMIKSPKCLKSECTSKDITKVHISASDRSVTLGTSKTMVTDRAVHVSTRYNSTVVEQGKKFKNKEQHYVIIEIKESNLAFKFQFLNEHLDLIVLDFNGISNKAHGIMGKSDSCHATNSYKDFFFFAKFNFM